MTIVHASYSSGARDVLQVLCFVLLQLQCNGGFSSAGRKVLSLALWMRPAGRAVADSGIRSDPKKEEPEKQQIQGLIKRWPQLQFAGGCSHQKRKKHDQRSLVDCPCELHLWRFTVLAFSIEEGRKVDNTTNSTLNFIVQDEQRIWSALQIARYNNCIKEIGWWTEQSSTRFSRI